MHNRSCRLLHVIHHYKVSIFLKWHFDWFSKRIIKKTISFTLRGASCLVLPCSLFMCFSVLLAFWSPCLGKRVLVFVLIVHLFISYAHVNLCHFLSSSWCRRLAVASACGSSWTFLFTCFINGPGHAKTRLMQYANNKGANQPARMRSLISTFDFRCLDSMIPTLAISKVLRF